MKVVKLGSIFLAAFAAAWVLLFTFTQEPFKAVAPVNLVFTRTPEFPMYTFAVGTFGIGLLIGFFVAAYYYIAGQAGIRSKKKEIKRLQDVIKGLEFELESLRVSTAETQEKITKSMKSIGEKDLFA